MRDTMNIRARARERRILFSMKKTVKILALAFAVIFLFSACSSANVSGSWKTEVSAAQSMSDDDIALLKALGISESMMSMEWIFDFGENGEFTMTVGNDVFGRTETNGTYKTESGKLYLSTDGNFSSFVEFSVKGSTLVFERLSGDSDFIGTNIQLPIEFSKID